MTGYRLATLQTEDGAKAAVLVGNRAYDAAGLVGDARYGSMQGILEDWDRAHARFAAVAASPVEDGTPLAEATLLAPLPRPNVIYCAGANYRDHAMEMERITGKTAEDPRADDAGPWFFLKSPHAVAAPGAPVSVTGYGRKVDWEAELVAIIGRRVRDVPVTEALGCVAGYTCGNDLSARDYVFRDSQPPGSPFRADWMRHKCFDDACPMGPWIVPAAYLSDPADLSIRLWVNGSLRQDSSTANMIYDVAEQISHLSRGRTLHPGDAVMTGTPAGVGSANGEFLEAGDEVRVEIDGIGVLCSHVE